MAPIRSGLCLTLGIAACFAPLHPALYAQQGNRASRPTPSARPSCRAADATDVRRLLRPVRSVLLQDADTEPIAGVGSVAISPSGRILLADDKDFNLKLFHPDGRLLRVLGQRGSGPGEFQSVAAATFVDESTVVVADHYRSRLIFMSVDGGLIRETLLLARPVGGIQRIGDRVFVGGFGWGDQRDAGSLQVLYVVGLRGDSIGRFGPLPSSYAQYPVLLLGPVLLAAPAPSGNVVYVTWRFANEVWRMDVNGNTVRRADLPNHRHFVDPRAAVARLGRQPMRRVIDQTSPILKLAASDSLVLVGYISPFAGDSRLRYHVLDANLGLIGSDYTGPLFLASSADTLIALEPGESESREVSHRLTWYAPCR